MPVLEHGRLVGVLSRSVVQRRLAEDEPPEAAPRRLSARLRDDVVVVMEDVVGVVLPLDLDETIVVRPVRGSHGIVALVVAEVVEPAPPGEVLG